MIKKLSLNSLIVAVAAVFGTQSASAEELTVYTALEADILSEYASQFNEDYPNIKINWVRDSTGIVTAKLLAEKNNPKADVVWGLAATSLMQLKDENMLAPYAPKGLNQLNDKFRDSAEVPYWTGMDAWVASICMNTVEAEKNNLPAPTSWKDLTNPVYKGHIIMPNPNSSGTGFLDVSSWLQIFGEQEGWAFMDGLHENISRYTHSGSKPCKLAASGETSIGISFAFRGAKLINKGAPIKLVFPEEGLGWDMEAAAIIKGTPKMEAAQKLIDWSVTPKANALYSKGYAVVAIDGVAKPIDNYPANINGLMMDNDFEWAAKNRKKILTEWQRRYDGKSEPK